MPFMDNKQIRRLNLKDLVAEAGGTAAFAELVHRSQSQISAMAHGYKPMGDRLARDLEIHLSKPVGWMDAPQWKGSTLHEAHPNSQPARLSVAKVIGTTQALQTFLKRRGLEYDPIQDAELFVAAYEEAAKMSEEPSTEELMGFGAVVADLFLAREARRHERAASKQAGSDTGEQDRDEGASKAARTGRRPSRT